MNTARLRLAAFVSPALVALAAQPVLAQAAFSQEVGAVGGPIESSLGWHVLQVVERGERPVPEEKRADLAQRRFEQWLDQLSASATIELFI